MQVYFNLFLFFLIILFKMRVFCNPHLSKLTRMVLPWGQYKYF